MPDDLEIFLSMRNSDDLPGSSESLIGNQDLPTLEQLNDRAIQQKLQNKSREKIENEEHKKDELDLENEMLNIENIVESNDLKIFLEKYYADSKEAVLIAKEYFEKQNSLGINVSKSELKNKVDSNIAKKEEISTADQIKNHKKQLTKQGKSQTEILQLLISKFENEEAVSTWVENWRNFQKLHQFAENKPPTERRAIQNIIATVDFTSENAFTTSLAEISKNSVISEQTKLEISREFGGAYIFSVDAMDSNLKQIKSHKNRIEKEIGAKSRAKNDLDSEIDELENEIEKLPLDDPKRQELEQKLAQKKEIFKQTETEIDRLEQGKPNDISFQLRDGFSAKLNADGSRSINILDESFAIKLPSNFLPLTTAKNLRSINLAFPYLVLKKLHIADSLFVPNLDNNSVPSKSHRDMGHLILSSLGIDDTRILSEENIKQLKTDLSKLTTIPGKSGQECLIELEVYNVASQSINKTKLKKGLTFIRENRGVNNDVFWDS